MNFPHRVADERLQALGGGPAGIAQVDLVVAALRGEIRGAALFCCKGRKLVNRGGLGVVGSHVEDVGAQPLPPAPEPCAAQIQLRLLTGQLLQSPGEYLLGDKIRLADQGCPVKKALVRRRPSRGGTTYSK